MDTLHGTQRQNNTHEGFLAVVGNTFDEIPDHTDYTLTKLDTPNVLITGLAMFRFKLTWMLKLNEYTHRYDRLKCYLKRLYGIDKHSYDTVYTRDWLRSISQSCTVLGGRCFPFCDNGKLYKFRPPNGENPIPLDGTDKLRSNKARHDTCPSFTTFHGQIAHNSTSQYLQNPSQSTHKIDRLVIFVESKLIKFHSVYIPQTHRLMDSCWL